MISKTKIWIRVAEVHLDKTFKPLTVGPVVNGVDGDGPDGDEG